MVSGALPIDRDIFCDDRGVGLCFLAGAGQGCPHGGFLAGKVSDNHFRFFYQNPFTTVGAAYSVPPHVVFSLEPGYRCESIGLCGVSTEVMHLAIVARLRHPLAGTVT